MSLGGVNFHDSVLQSIHIGNFVRNRARVNKHCETPINCINGGDNVCLDHTVRARIRQKKSIEGENFDTRLGPKERQIVGTLGAQQQAFQAEAPASFFGLPYFDAQIELVAEGEPNRSGDAAGFLFVDLNKFMARNASSVLHNVIFG